MTLLKFQEPQMTNYDEAKRCCKMESHILTDIVNEYFPPFNELPVSDKVRFVYFSLIKVEFCIVCFKLFFNFYFSQFLLLQVTFY